MKCFKCGSTYVAMRRYTINELAKGSPTRGKNKKYKEVKVTEIKCKECQSSEMTYA